MTTATVTDSMTGSDTDTGTGTESTVKGVRSAEVARLDDALAASEPRLAGLKIEAVAAQEDLTTANADLATLGQQASTLQQQLGAATTGPERHRIELELDANQIRQGPVTDRKLTAAERLAVAALAVKRETALAEKLKGDLARATVALTQARQDAAAATVRLGALDPTVGGVKAGAAALAEQQKQATDRIAVLLGGPEMLARVQDRVEKARAEVEQRSTALTAAEVAVLDAAVARSGVDGPVARTGAALATARDAVRDAVEAAPVRLAAATAVLDQVRDLPALPPADQAAITAAAAKVTGDAAPAVVDAWEVAVPVAVTGLAIALIDAVRALDDLRSIDAVALRKDLTDAEPAHAATLAAQIAVQLRQDAAAAVADAARDGIAAHEPTAAQRRLSLVRGDR